MKIFKPNEKYTKIAIYALVTIFACILFIIFCINIGKIISAVTAFLGAIKSIFYGVIIALFVYPLMSSFQRMLKTLFFSKKTRPKLVSALSMVLAYLTIFIVLFILVFAIVPVLSDEFDNFVTQIRPKYDNLVSKFSTIKEQNDFFALMADKFKIAMGDTPFSFLDPVTIINAVVAILGEFYNIAIGLIISIYLILSRNQFGAIFGKIFTALFSQKRARRLTLFSNRLYRNIAQYLSVRMISSLYIACLCYTVCWLFKIPFYPVITLSVFVGNFIPVFGPVVITGATMVMMLIYNAWMAPLLLAIIIGSQLFDSFLIERKMLPVRLRPNIGVTIVLVIISFLILGIIGVLLAIPVFATVFPYARMMFNRLARNKMKKKTAKAEENIENTEDSLK